MHYIIAHTGFYIYCERPGASFWRALRRPVLFLHRKRPALGGEARGRVSFLHGGSVLCERVHDEKDRNEEGRWKSIIGKENGDCCFCVPGF